MFPLRSRSWLSSTKPVRRRPHVCSWAELFMGRTFATLLWDLETWDPIQGSQ